jgi:hypothetical protein
MCRPRVNGYLSQIPAVRFEGMEVGLDVAVRSCFRDGLSFFRREVLPDHAGLLFLIIQGEVKMSRGNLKLRSKIKIESVANQINLERLNSNRASYGDLMDAFARELTSDEILLISGASKSGGSYSGTAYA